MSACKLGLIVAPRAQRDIRSIHLFGARHWGDAQADAYQATLTKAADLLREYPLIGRARDDLGAGLRSWPVEHHVPYYRINGDVVEVVRILHERVDAARHLRP